MKQFITACLLMAFFFGNAQADTTAEKKEIEKTLNAFMAAWNVHDAKAFAAQFAEDADFTNVRGAGAHGRAAVEAFHAPLFATRFKDTHQTLLRHTVRFIKPDVAAVDAWWDMTGAKDPEGKEIPKRQGLLNFILTKTAGAWLITVMHNMDLPPQP